MGLLLVAEMPQGLTRLASRCWALPGMLETRSVSRNEPRAISALTPSAGSVIPTAVATASPAVNSLRAYMRESSLLVPVSRTFKPSLDCYGTGYGGPVPAGGFTDFLPPSHPLLIGLGHHRGV